jgi:hypothetical protein
MYKESHMLKEFCTHVIMNVYKIKLYEIEIRAHSLHTRISSIYLNIISLLGSI